MAYLQLDGMTIPVAAGSGKLAIQEVGYLERAIDGTAIRSLRGVKRQWDIVTPPVSEDDALALEALVLGRGVFYPFDQSLGIGVASNAFVSPQAINIFNQNGGLCIDFTGSQAVGDLPFGHFTGGRYGGIVPQGYTNLLSADASSFGTGTGGCTAYSGASIARDTGANSIDSSGALAATMVNGSYVQWPNTTVPSGQLGTFTVYVRPSVQMTVRVCGWLNGINAGNGIDTVCQPGRWTRLCWTVVSSGAGVVAPYVQAINGSAGTLYMDWAQLEAETGASPWILGGTSYGGAGTLIQPVNTAISPSAFAGAQGWDKAITINVWARWTPTRTGLADRYMVVFSPVQGSGEVCWFWLIGNWNPTQMLFVMGNWWTSDYSPTFNDFRWHMFTGAATRLGDGSILWENYFDGALLGTHTSIPGQCKFPDMGAMAAVSIGGNGGGGNWGAGIAYPLIIPARLTPKWISALYNGGNGAQPGYWPRHRLTGDIVGGRDAAMVLGKVVGSDPVDFRDGGGVWRAGRRVSFQLHEV